MAFSTVNSDTGDGIRLSNLNILNSYKDIISVNGKNKDTKLILSGNTSFLANQGSILVLHGAIEFEGFVLVSNNIAQKVYFV